MKKRIVRLLKPVLLTCAAALTMLALLVPPQPLEAAPECQTEIMTDSNGNQCLVCVDGGDGQGCVCGGKICHA